MTVSRYAAGALEPRYVIERVDGKPIPADRRYSMILDFSGADPHALVAARAYADSVRKENAVLADGILDAIANPAGAPPQHRYA